MKRPRSVTFLALLVLSLTVVSFIRFGKALELWDVLLDLPLTVSPGYLALSGLMGGIVGLPLSWGLWRGWHWSARALRTIAPLYIVYYWIDRLLMAGEASRWEAWPMRLGASALSLLVVYWLASRPAAKAFIGESHG